MALRTNDGHDKGVSLARGPALIIGSLLLAFGLLAFLADGDSPTDGFPDGTITNIETFLGIGVNDWTAFFTATAGGLLLFGAAQHLLAKTMSLIVGLALGACSVIALVDGDDVLGLAGANGWTKLGWGAAAIALLVNALLPRKGGKDHHDHDAHREPVVAPRTTHREPVETRPVATTHREPAPTTHRETVRAEPTVTERVAPRTEARVQDTTRGGVPDRGLDPRDGRGHDPRDDRGLDPRDDRGVDTRDRLTDRGTDTRDGSVSDDRLRDDRLR